MGVTGCREQHPPHGNADLHEVIVECLRHSHFADALTLSEMYYEKNHSDDALLFICECLSRLGRIEELYSLLSSRTLNNPRLRYTYARCCFDMNKMDESMRALVIDPCEAAVPGDSTNPLMGVELHPVLNGTPSAAFANILLSKILCETGAEKRSCALAGRAVEQNPFLWSSVSQYLQLGGKEAVKQFDLHASVIAAEENETKKIEDCAKEEAMEEDQNEEEPDHHTPIRQIGTIAPPRPVAPRKGRPSEVLDVRRSTRQFAQDSENAGLRTTRVTKPKTTVMRTVSCTTTKEKEIKKVSQSHSRTFRSISQRVRVHPETEHVDPTKQPLSSRNANLRSNSSSSQNLSSGSRRRENEREKDKDKDDSLKKVYIQTPYSDVYKEVFATVRCLTEVEECISQYDFVKAIELLEKVPLNRQKLAVCTLQKARVVFETCDYQSAREILMELRRTHPYRLEGMDLLSTALWHLQKNYELSVLAQDLTSRARNRAESWCVAGNCFSLQKLHAKSVECLQRAIRLDPHYGYAFSLLGHELIEIDQMDEASQAFRKSLSINPNDYRAWYGLGMVNHRKEQHALAQRDLSRALRLNKTNVSLLCQLAVVEKALGKTDEAVKLLTYALQLDPNRMVSRFHLAKLQYEMGEFDQCIAHLEELKVTSPDEAQIFFLLGKAHRRLNHTHLALLNFNWAAEMDPRGEQTMNYMNEQPYDDDGSP